MTWKTSEEDHPIFTWFPKKEDYEEKEIQVMSNETTEDKVSRLLETIELNQANIKEIVDQDTVILEHKIYRTMDLRQDMLELQDLLKTCEEEDKENKFADQIKKGKIGIINLKAYLGQVDVIEFVSAIRNEHQFRLGCDMVFGPWLDKAEVMVTSVTEKPLNFDHAREVEVKACQFLKEVVKANKNLKLVQTACEGIRGSVDAQERMSKLQERYYVLCKKAEGRVKTIQQLMIEWTRLEDLLRPTDPADMDDYIPKQMITFLRTYKKLFGHMA